MTTMNNNKNGFLTHSDSEELETLTQNNGLSDTYALRRKSTTFKMGLDATSIKVDMNGDTPNHIKRNGTASTDSKRIVLKHGHLNVKKTNVEGLTWHYTLDLFTTLLEVSWKWTLLSFCIVYFGSWIIFSIGWYLIAYVRDDLNPINIENSNGTWKFCVTGITGFTTAFLFSVETQHTTGYGFYQLTDECPEAIILLCVQSIVGVILEGIMVGLVFVKISRAKRRRATIMFSRNAVISERDGKLYFMFRVADMRKNHLIEPRIRAQFVKKHLTSKGELVRSSQKEFNVCGEGESSNRLFLFWPTIIVHEINSSSPFYKIVPEDLEPNSNNRFEVVVILEGTIESTGHETQARTSYLPEEILWGHYFYDLNESSTGKSLDSGERVIDYSLFHETFVPEPVS